MNTGLKNRITLEDKIFAAATGKQVDDVAARKEAKTPKVWAWIRKVSGIASQITGMGGILGVAIPLLGVPGVNIPTWVVLTAIGVAGLFKGLNTASKYQVERSK